MPTEEKAAAEAQEPKVETQAEEVKVDPAEETARSQGWKPKEEYAGDPALWVDAKEFLGRAPLFEKIKGQTKAVKDLQRTVDAMAKNFTKIVDATANAKIAELKAAKREAIESGDAARVEVIEKAIDEQKAVKADAPTAPAVAPAVKEWVDRNGWYTTDQEMHDFALAYNDSYLKRHPEDIEGSLEATEKATKRAFPEKFPGARKGSAAPAVEGATAPTKAAQKYSVTRLTNDQKLAHDQYIKAGTFDELAKAAKMTPSEFYVRQMDEIGELTR